MMNEEVLNDYEKISDVDQSLIQEFREKLPEEVINIWEKCGFGSFMNGYLKVVNPDDYTMLLEDSYFQANVSIPIFVTAFGDVITWEKNQNVGIVLYRYGTNECMIRGFGLFLKLLNDPSFVKRYFTIEKFNEAVEMHGSLSYDECFGYVPLLAIGGKETTKNLKKVKIREHIALITALVGEI